jgi:hypothetical protein
MLQAGKDNGGREGAKVARRREELPGAAIARAAK